MPRERLLETVGLAKTFEARRNLFGSAGTIRAVDGVDLRLDAGETLAIVGESGSGKTTLGRLVTLQEKPSGGTVLFDGREIVGLRGSALKAYRRRVQMIFQNPYEALDPRFTVGDAVLEPLNLHRIGSAAERRERAEAALAAVELRPAAAFVARYPADLSGGQLQRVAIARALVLDPRLIVADEPVSMLDVSVRSGIMNLMRDLQDRLGVSYLTITHDLGVARHMASRVAVMYLGAVVEEGPTDTLIGAAGHPYTRLLVAAVPSHRPGTTRSRVRIPGDAASVEHVPAGCRFHPRCPMAVAICRTVVPPRMALAANHTAACHFAPQVSADGLARPATEVMPDPKAKSPSPFQSKSR